MNKYKNLYNHCMPLIKNYFLIFIIFNFFFGFFFYIDPYIYHEDWTFLRNTSVYEYFGNSNGQNIFLNPILWSENRYFAGMGRFLVYVEYNLLDSLINSISDLRKVKIIHAIFISIFTLSLFYSLNKYLDNWIHVLIFSFLLLFLIPINTKIHNITSTFYFLWSATSVYVGTLLISFYKNNFFLRISILYLYLLLISFIYPDIIYFSIIPFINLILLNKNRLPVDCKILLFHSALILLIFFVNFLIVRFVIKYQFLSYISLSFDDIHNIYKSLDFFISNFFSLNFMFLYDRIKFFFLYPLETWFFFKNIYFFSFLTFIFLISFFYKLYKSQNYNFTFYFWLSIFLIYIPLFLVGSEMSPIRNNFVMFYIFGLVTYIQFLKFISNKYYKNIYLILFIFICLYSSISLHFFQNYLINKKVYTNIRNQLKFENKFNHIGFIEMENFNFDSKFNKIKKSPYDFLNFKNDYYGDPFHDILNYSGARANGNVPYIIKGFCTNECLKKIDKEALNFSSIYEKKYSNEKDIIKSDDTLIINLNFIEK
jgi:hypothetical protein